MSDAIKCFRTITRVGLFHQVEVNGAVTLVPIGIASPPASININPGDDIEEVPEIAQDGRQVIGLTYTKGAKPELEMEFSLAAPDLEGIIHGRKFASGSSVEGYVFSEFVPTTTSVAARTTGQAGFGVIAQVAATTKALAYRIDKATKLSVPLEIVDSSDTPEDDQIKIGAAMAITVSPELVGEKIQLWCPQVFATATILTSTPIGLISVFAQGISFDNTARFLKVLNCSRLPGNAIGSDPKRQIKLRILPDPSDGTGLGYSMSDTALLTP